MACAAGSQRCTSARASSTASAYRRSLCRYAHTPVLLRACSPSRAGTGNRGCPACCTPAPETHLPGTAPQTGVASAKKPRRQASRRKSYHQAGRARLRSVDCPAQSAACRVRPATARHSWRCRPPPRKQSCRGSPNRREPAHVQRRCLQAAGQMRCRGAHRPQVRSR